MVEFQKIAYTMAVLPKGASINDELVTLITIADEGAGPYVEVNQCGDGRVDLGTIKICADDWTMIREAIDLMIGTCGGLDAAERQAGNDHD